MLNINDVFWTIQGEGFNAGRAALFIRMPFCNLKCSWCDTEFNSFKAWHEDDLVEQFKKYPARFAVVTGGEPSLNKQVHRVIELLKSYNFEIAMESNGTFNPPNGVNWLTVSPKRDAKPTPYYIAPEAMRRASEFKYVVDESFQWGILDRHNVNDGRMYYLSPEFNQMDLNVQRIMEFISKNPQWTLSLQTHKWMNIK